MQVQSSFRMFSHSVRAPPPLYAHACTVRVLQNSYILFASCWMPSISQSLAIRYHVQPLFFASCCGELCRCRFSRLMRARDHVTLSGPLSLNSAITLSFYKWRSAELPNSLLYRDLGAWFASSSCTVGHVNIDEVHPSRTWIFTGACVTCVLAQGS